MKPRADEALVEIRDALLETCAVNEAMNQWRTPTRKLGGHPRPE